ncbi:hypothetical protein MUP65_01900 [Patescibacteria group bacterium]|nr:hypothetical protein [Patescibacteria group bacterium]
MGFFKKLLGGKGGDGGKSALPTQKEVALSQIPEQQAELRYKREHPGEGDRDDLHEGAARVAGAQLGDMVKEAKNNLQDPATGSEGGQPPAEGEGSRR